ncbi:MAG: DUF4115 domain-containing protein [Hydrogenophaga sp.]|nr:DUF4115 domain-containing protein [Hydrogenophaga sp.]
MSDRSAQDATAAVATEDHAFRPVLLSQAREAAGLHIAALAAALKVPVKKLEALEAGHYDELPDLVFARALASSACRQLKVDPTPILKQIPAGVTPQLGDSGTAINTPFKPASGGTAANSVGWLSRPAVLAAVVLILGALLLVFLPEVTHLADPVINAPAADALPGESPELVSSASVEGSTVPNEALVQSAMPAATTDAGAALSIALKPAPVAPAIAAHTAGTTAATGGAVDAAKVLVIRATGESWIEVKTGTGVVLIQRMLKAGDTVDFSAAPPYSVVVGRVDNAEVQVRGRAFDAVPFARNGVARFQVK